MRQDELTSAPVDVTLLRSMFHESLGMSPPRCSLLGLSFTLHSVSEARLVAQFVAKLLGYDLLERP